MPEGTPPALDTALLVEHQDGDLGFARELVGAFLGVMPRYLDDLHQAATAGDAAALARAAHRLKGSLRTLHAAPAAAHAAAIEEAARGGAAAPGMLVAFEAETGRLRAACEAFLTGDHPLR